MSKNPPPRPYDERYFPFLEPDIDPAFFVSEENNDDDRN